MGRREEEEITRAPAATPGSPAFRPHRGRQREDIYQIGISSKVTALDIGAYKLDVWAEDDHGNRITELAAGQVFKVKAEFEMENVGALYWLTCITLKGTGVSTVPKQGYNYDDTKVAGESKHLTVILGPFNMMNQNMNMTVTLWAHDDYGVSPPYPPAADW